MPSAASRKPSAVAEQQLQLEAHSKGSMVPLDGGQRLRLDGAVDFWPATQAWTAVDSDEQGAGTTSMLAYLVKARERAGDPVPEPEPIETSRRLDCAYCGQPAGLFTGREVYPDRVDLHERRFWVCWPCDAWVGCHEGGDGSAPLGPLADEALRDARRAAHQAFAPLWHQGEMSRSEAYEWLAARLRMPVFKCRIVWFSVEECRAVVDAVAALRTSPPDSAHRTGSAAT